MKFVFKISPLILFIGACVTGCAGEIVAMNAGKMATTAMTVLANKIPITSGNIKAQGVIDNPEYEVDVFYVQGVKVRAQLKGAKISGELYGQGEGGSNTIDPALAQLLEAQRLDPNSQTIARKIVDHLLSRPPTTQPVDAKKSDPPPAIPPGTANAEDPCDRDEKPPSPEIAHRRIVLFPYWWITTA